jgi:hypothetical protein
MKTPHPLEVTSSLQKVLKKTSETSTMSPTLESRVGDLEVTLRSLERRLSNIESRLSKIPDPFVIYYRPPHSEDYEKLNLALDDLYARINKVENKIDL